MKDKIIFLQTRWLGVTRYADVLLAVGVVLILSLMIMPIPPFLLALRRPRALRLMPSRLPSPPALPPPPPAPAPAPFPCHFSRHCQ